MSHAIATLNFLFLGTIQALPCGDGTKTDPQT
jgi:hypothetical protein